MVSNFVVLAILAVVSCSLALPNLDSAERQFKHFLRTHNRHYESLKEYEYRFKIFKNNLQKIEHFQSVEQGTATFGITKFADRTYDEIFSRSFSPEQLRKTFKTVPPFSVKNIPTSFDWRDHNAVTEVKDQGNCGSCWAFSAVGNIEGQYAIKYKNLLSFSNQEVLDCQNHTFSCQTGGLPIEAYAEVKTVGGLELDSDYPYVAKVQKCNVDYSKIVAQVSDGVALTTNEDSLAQWLYSNGPISIGINAEALPAYTGGIYHPTEADCSPKALDHGVVIVGYGVENDIPYWIIKNSWAADWGEKGYFRIFRGEGCCGLNTAATTSVIV